MGKISLASLLMKKNNGTINSKERKKLEKMLKHKKEKKEKKEKNRLKKTNPELFKEKYLEKVDNNGIISYIDPNLRTKDERIEQVERLKSKLNEVGFYEELSGFKKFISISDKFIETGERIEESIIFEEMHGVKLNILLSSKKSIECSITVKNWKAPESCHRAHNYEEVVKNN